MPKVDTPANSVANQDKICHLIIRCIENSLKADSLEYLSVFNVALRIRYISEQPNDSMRCNHLLHLGLKNCVTLFQILISFVKQRICDLIIPLALCCRVQRPLQFHC